MARSFGGDSRVEARDVGSVLAVLDEVAERLDSRGVRQWPRRFQPSWVTPAIEEGHPARD